MDMSASTRKTEGDTNLHIDAQPLNKEHGQPLYAGREKIYAKLVTGPFRNAKWIIMAVTLGIYYLTPWIRWDRGPSAPDQAVLVDFPGRRFYFFFIEIWPQEVYYITGLLILAAVGLFLVTSIAGRVWCGYACPQTVWTDLFIYVERLVEGDRNKRMRLDKAPWTIGKLSRKTLKHAIWLLIAIATGGAWVFYFADAPTLARELLTFEAQPIVYLSIGLFTFTTYLLGGIAREQVCTYMCPWPRIQGAMFDENTFAVSYKADRGEPRGAHKKGDSWDDRGDCIDCNQCVAACPMGIDIRDGLQLECIQCALCIDACDSIMAKIDRPKGLIGYDSLQNQRARETGSGDRTRVIRPRTIIYVGVLALVAMIMVTALVLRTPTEVNVIADRNPLFVQLSNGDIRNGFTVKILNKGDARVVFDVSIDGLEGATISRGLNRDSNALSLDVPADSLETGKFFVQVSREAFSQQSNEKGTATFSIIIQNKDTNYRVVETVSFKGPSS